MGIFRIKARVKISEKMKRQMFPYSRNFDIPGSKNLNWNSIYLFKKNYLHFQRELEEFK